ncbi:MAG TPA: hypothetical protein VEI49_01215 [Terriglobales bacterium]|nr:hypothetical protein [Terriglobales bacterium]
MIGVRESAESRPFKPMVGVSGDVSLSLYLLVIPITGLITGETSG